MTRLWIGDFRLDQLQIVHNNIKPPKSEDDKAADKDDATEEDSTNTSVEVEDLYLVESEAELTWFNTTVAAQLPLMSLFNTMAIIMIGFNDCAYSCVWQDTFKINTIAKSYADTINELISSYPDISFYVCSVAPISADYTICEHVINKTTLNDKIKQFNKTLSENCEALFIDTYTYLTEAGFKTRDGIRNTVQSCTELREYILSQLMFTMCNSFTLRAEKKADGSIVLRPPKEEDGEAFLYWKTNASGGYSDCIEVKAGTGCTLPNCVGYAYGRFMEIMQSASTTLEPDTNLSAGNAKVWFGNTADGYERSDKDNPGEAKPRPGAVMCWDHTSRGGHVAIVEQVLDDGSVITSESGWSDARPAYKPDNRSHFYSNNRKRGDGNWGQGSAYTFQGFIYNPAATFGGSTADYVTKAQVTSCNDSLGETEMQLNARYVWQYLGSKGWTLNAVAAMLGNMQNESSINPGRFEYYTLNKTSPLYLGPNPTQAEIETYLARYKEKKGRYPGYGMTQWTSTDISSWSQHKLVSWCTSRGLDYTDIDSQLQRIAWEAENNKQWYGYDQDRADYPISFRDFTASYKDPEWLAAAFLLRYEIPGDRYAALPGRQTQARKWYEYLLPYAPGMAAVLSISNLKIRDTSPTSVRASFIVRSWEKYEYELLDNDNNQIYHDIVENLDIKNKESDDDIDDTNTEDSDGAPETATSKIDPTLLGKAVYLDFGNLVPNKQYLLNVKAFGASEADEVEASLDFTTRQDPPDSITNLTLVAEDEKLPNELFKLDFTPPRRWGYWKNTDHGYTVQLLVNGKKAYEFDTTELGLGLFSNLSLPLVFPLYKSKVAETVQIGIRTWVKDDTGLRIYDSADAVTSNTICFLKQPFIQYLNRKDLL